MGYIKSIEQLWLAPKETVTCLIEPGLLPVGGLMTITGEPGQGKSFACQQGAFEIATGRRFLGLFPTIKSKVCVIEQEKRSAVSRLRYETKECQETYPDAEGMLGLYDETVIQMDTTGGRRYMRTLLHDFGCKVCFVDSYSVTLNDELDLSTQKGTIKAYREIAKELGIAFILVMHLNKRGINFDPKAGQYKEPPLRLDDMRGSKVMQYEIDTSIGIVSRKSTRLVSFLKHSFSEYPLSEKDPLEYEFCGSSAVPFQLLNKKTSAILSVIEREGACSLLSIEEKLKITRNTLRDSLNVLVGYGIVEIVMSKGQGGETYIKPRFQESLPINQLHFLPK